jgi:hypothetical protein
MSNEPISKNSQTDWQRLDAMDDEDIDLSDCPEVTPEQFAKAVVQVTRARISNSDQRVVKSVHGSTSVAVSVGNGRPSPLHPIIEVSSLSPTQWRVADEQTHPVRPAITLSLFVGRFGFTFGRYRPLLIPAHRFNEVYSPEAQG